MNIILKTTFKNIFGKPLRTLLVVFSIFACSFVALLCFDLAKAEKNAIRQMFQGFMGNADLSVTVNTADPDLIPADLPEYKALVIRTFSDMIYKDIEGEVSFVTQDTLTISGVDPAKAMGFGCLKDVSIADDEALVTNTFADEYGYSEGDILTVHDMAGKPHDLTIVKILPSDSKNVLLAGKAAIVNENTADILACHKPVPGRILLDITDNARMDDARDILNNRFGFGNVTRFTVNDRTNELFDQLFGILFILFAVTFLLVVFITFSICERIVCERMSFIGTLRSLGLSSRRTAAVLLLENVSYAVLGSIPGTLLYLLIRDSLLTSTLTVKTSDGSFITPDFPGLSPLLVAAVFLTAILIECLIPLKAVLKALKTSIRDIIFDNRDTAYRMSKGSMIAGILTALIGIIALCFRNNLLCAGLCLIACVVAMALLFPWILKYLAEVIEYLAERKDRRKLALAAREAKARKSTVGSGVLCATSACMCILIYMLSSSIMGMMDADVYDCDVIVTCADKAKKFSFVKHLDNVTDTEFVYTKTDMIRIGEEEAGKSAVIFGLPENGFRFYRAIRGLTEPVGEGEIAVEEGWSKRYGVKVGDSITLSFDPEGVFPVTKIYRVVDLFKINSYYGGKNTFVLSEQEYKSIYHDSPGELLVRSTDPDATARMIRTYAVSAVEYVQTKQELIDDYSDQTARSDRIFLIIILVALGMTGIGMISNQIIGFEGRKKECAVMLSTSMSRRTLSGILFREILIMSLTSVTAGCLLGSILTLMLKGAVANAEMIQFEIGLNVPAVLVMWATMTVLFTLTVLFPIKNLRKMKISEQLKYE